MTLPELRKHLPVATLVRYLDTTIVGTVRRRKSVRGTVFSVGEGANGKLSVTVLLKDGRLTTLPENLTVLKRPSKHKHPIA